jgi:hypothetical protein
MACMLVVAAASVVRSMSVVRGVTVSSAVGVRGTTVVVRRRRTMCMRAGFRWVCTVLVFPMRWGVCHCAFTA